MKAFCMGGRGPGLIPDEHEHEQRPRLLMIAGGQRTPARSTERQSPPCLIAAAYGFPIKYCVLVKFVMYSFLPRLAGAVAFYNAQQDHDPTVTTVGGELLSADPFAQVVPCMPPVPHENNTTKAGSWTMVPMYHLIYPELEFHHALRLLIQVNPGVSGSSDIYIPRQLFRTCSPGRLSWL